MSAIEFVKEFGIDVAILNYSSCKHQYYFHYNGHIEVCVADLKQIIDAWELVDSKGGLVECKKILSRDNFSWCSGGNVYGNPLERAVNLVEQCR